MDKTLKRTQVSLCEYHRDFLKTAAEVATWRLRNDPLEDSPDPNTDVETRVSMAEVLRLIIDGTMWASAQGKGDLWNEPDPIEKNARTREIQHAFIDTMTWNESSEKTPVGEFPDSRS